MPMSTSSVILAHVESLGYVVKRFTVNGVVELHAVPLAGGEPQIARCNDGHGVEEEYRTACLLAAAVGIDLGA